MNTKRRRGKRTETPKVVCGDRYVSERKLAALRKSVAWLEKRYESTAGRLRRYRRAYASGWPPMKRSDFGWLLIWSEEAKELHGRLARAKERLQLAEAEVARRHALREAMQAAAP